MKFAKFLKKSYEDAAKHPVIYFIFDIFIMILSCVIGATAATCASIRDNNGVVAKAEEINTQYEITPTQYIVQESIWQIGQYNLPTTTYLNRAPTFTYTNDKLYINTTYYKQVEGAQVLTKTQHSIDENVETQPSTNERYLIATYRQNSQPQPQPTPNNGYIYIWNVNKSISGNIQNAEAYQVYLKCGYFQERAVGTSPDTIYYTTWQMIFSYTNNETVTYSFCINAGLNFVPESNYGENILLYDNISSYVTGYKNGVNSINTTAIYQSGYTNGFNDATQQGSSNDFLGLVSAVVNVPVNIAKGLFNFEFLGYNMQNVMLSILTIFTFIAIIRFILGHTGDGGGGDKK